LHLRDGARRMLVTLGAGLLLLIVAAAGNPPSALAASGYGLPGAGVWGGSGTSLGNELPGSAGSTSATVARFSGSSPAMAPLRQLLQADLFVVAPTTLASGIAAAVQRLRGVVAAEPLDAARLQVDGKLTAMLGVDPSEFRAFAAKPTADSLGLWKNVAAGGVAVSYTMSKLDNLPLGHPVKVTGRRVEDLPVAGLGTVGIGGVDAVVSDAVARSLGLPAGNAIVISAPHADLNTLTQQIKKLLPRDAAIASLVAQSASTGVAETGGGAGIAGANGPGLTTTEVIDFLKAAESRLGLP
jgi:peptidoglycan DL-endopeptidase CwlO